MEIRVYYESIEQANFYIKPIIEESLSKLKVKEYTIKLIKKVQQNFNKSNKFSKKYSKSISNILIQKNPDIIISIIKDDIEIPIAIIEFSTAVFTKDHELQRTDNFNVAHSSEAVYIKVSSNDKKTPGHGGDSKYNFVQPYAMHYQNTDDISFHINWEVKEDDASILIKDSQYKSLPANRNEITHLIYLILKNFSTNLKGNYWKKGFNDLVKNDAIFSTWLKSLKEFDDFEDITTLTSSRTIWKNKDSTINKENVFILKFNRFGHSMDPERGMLSYYGTYYKNEDNTFVSKIILDPSKEQWFKGTSQYSGIRKFMDDGLSSSDDLVTLLFMGLNLPDYEYYKDHVQKNGSIYDITDYVKKYLLNFNVSFRNIIINSDFFHLTDGDEFNIYLTWDKNQTSQFSFEKCPNVTEIAKRNDFSEDDVTFITIHNFFKENGIDTFSVSYPGAQSDTPVLPDKYSGRSQDRTYIDAIGLKGDSLIFQENKGPFKKADINDDLSKMKKFKVEVDYQKAVKDFKRKYGMDQKYLILGVGFGMGSRTQVKDVYEKTTIDDVDYFLIISKDMTTWKVYSSLDPENQPFIKLRGEIKRIPTYKVNS